ncbi:lipoyl protein ligase domain-containing protein [Pacificoceanicola onchidii]|uniref:lipoyl protein ligase domain-containing protein n=1 Tax=Pacificoceanicola onchidii TaxID=2562685 RepID=UPI001455F8D7|nr:hypothetical protein [Pacificoceanicola onchidii]
MTAALHSLPDAADGLAFEADLFSGTDAAVGIWTAATRALVCPKAYQARKGFAEAAEASRQRGWPVHLRPTGGGIVPQGPGVVNLALAFNAPKDFNIEDSYRLFTQVIIDGYGAHGALMHPGETPGSFCDGAWNLSVAGRKLVGTAQRWRPVRGGRPRVLVHALILTTDTFGPGARAVDALHAALGLDPVSEAVHTSTESAFGLTTLPAEALITAAKTALASIHTPNT